MASKHQAQVPLQNLSSQEKHSEIFPNLHCSLISIGKLREDECIVAFDKHKLIVSKSKDIIIEGYWDPTNGLWRFLLHHTFQNNKQPHMLEHITSKHWYQHIKPMSLRHPRAHCPISQQDLAIFYHQIL